MTLDEEIKLGCEMNICRQCRFVIMNGDIVSDCRARDENKNIPIRPNWEGVENKGLLNRHKFLRLGKKGVVE